MNSPSPLDLSPWAKTHPTDMGVVHPLLFHLMDAAMVTMELWNVFLAENQRQVIAEGLGMDSEQARQWVAFCAGLHDLGKLAPGFQQCAGSVVYASVSDRLRQDAGTPQRVGHATASLMTVFALLLEIGYSGDGLDRTALMVAECLGAHHGRLDAQDLRNLGKEPVAGLGGGSWAELRREYLRTVHEVVGAPPVPVEVPVEVAVLVCGLVVLADWLCSQEEYWTPWAVGPRVTVLEHADRSAARAQWVVRDADLARVTPQRMTFGDLHGIKEANPLQRSIIEELDGGVNGPGILVVTAATGDGKTEIALEAERILAEASGTQGLCFVLPTMATSDQMYQRVARAVGRQAAEVTAVTLTHSMAWLSEAYQPIQDEARRLIRTCEDGTDQCRDDAKTLPGRWLRGSKRPLLAQNAVGTIDQALLAVLPVRHNALRMLALSGKTFIVDEAHAYDPYMQVLLGRLLGWLGRYRCPVVLLSATLPASVAKDLIGSYRRGARSPGRPRIEVPYPGWLFAGVDGQVLAVSSERQTEQARHRRTTLLVEQVRIRHTPLPSSFDETDGSASSHSMPAAPKGSRLAVIESLLTPLVEDRGSAAVVCNTVADAQDTYRYLADRCELGPDELVLLHARIPGDQREARTEQIVARLGRRNSGRRGRFVVVATQVIEQSLDLDVDLMVSDIAPVSLLLQRAGRCWRHEHAWTAAEQAAERRERPLWATRPRLIVLDGLTDDGSPPKHWGEVYPAYLLATTRNLLATRAETHLARNWTAAENWQASIVEVPEDVQELVEHVHGRDSQFYRETAHADQKMEYDGTVLAQQQLGKMVALPAVTSVSSLKPLLGKAMDEVEVSTRLGADAVRVLCCYRHPGSDRPTLDLDGLLPLPQARSRGRIPVGDVQKVMRKTLPLNETWVVGRGPEQAPPQDWAEHPLLGELVLLVHDLTDGKALPVQVGDLRLQLSPELGLVRETTR